MKIKTKVERSGLMIKGREKDEEMKIVADGSTNLAKCQRQNRSNRDQFPVSAYAGSSKNLKDLKDPNRTQIMQLFESSMFPKNVLQRIRAFDSSLPQRVVLTTMQGFFVCDHAGLELTKYL